MSLKKTLTAGLAAAAVIVGGVIAGNPELRAPFSSAATPSSTGQDGFVLEEDVAGGDVAGKDVALAQEQLVALVAKGRAPKTGYSRAEFGQAWTDAAANVAGARNGCDTRNDILNRDLVDKVWKKGTNGCVVLSGTLLSDPYTGKTINFTRGRSTSAAIQIEHVVALSDSWQKGAQQLTFAERTSLANDPDNLLAVDGPANQAKRDSDYASWVPPNRAFRCDYAIRQIGVKTKYRLWVTPAEKSALGAALAKCRR